MDNDEVAERKDVTTMPLTPKYASFIAFRKERHCLLPSSKDDNWRLTDRICGQIHGIPGSRGILTATNGILCVIEQDANVNFLGHIAWFVADRDEEQQTVENEKASSIRVAKHNKKLEEWY